MSRFVLSNNSTVHAPGLQKLLTKGHLARRHMRGMIWTQHVPQWKLEEFQWMGQVIGTFDMSDSENLKGRTETLRAPLTPIPSSCFLIRLTIFSSRPVVSFGLLILSQGEIPPLLRAPDGLFECHLPSALAWSLQSTFFSSRG